MREPGALLPMEITFTLFHCRLLVKQVVQIFGYQW